MPEVRHVNDGDESNHRFVIVGCCRQGNGILIQGLLFERSIRSRFRPNRQHSERSARTGSNAPSYICVDSGWKICQPKKPGFFKENSTRAFTIGSLRKVTLSWPEFGERSPQSNSPAQVSRYVVKTRKFSDEFKCSMQRNNFIHVSNGFANESSTLFRGVFILGGYSSKSHLNESFGASYESRSPGSLPSFSYRCQPEC